MDTDTALPFRTRVTMPSAIENNRYDQKLNAFPRP